MSNKVIVTIDQGSSSSRVLAVDQQGRVVAALSRAVHTKRPQPGYAELDAEQIWQDQLAMLQEVMAQITSYTVQGISIASQRSTVVFWDKETGKSLAPALSWQDGRAAAISQQVSLTQEQVHQLTGLYNTPFYSAAKIAWALEHIAAVAQAAQENRLCIGPVASYLIWQLTGGQVFACDATLAQRTLLLNINRLDWDDDLLAQFHIARAWLPQIKRTTDNYGTWRQSPITVCVGDQQAALTALRIEPGQACINYGTGAFFMRHTGAQCKRVPGLLTSVAAQGSGQQESAAYLLEGPVNACSTVFTWLEAMGFALGGADLDALYAQAKAPLQILPALGGLGAPYWDFTLSPVLAGMTAQTTLADVAAGAVNAIAYLLADIVYYAARNGATCPDMKVSGGFAHHASLLQAQADILQCPLVPCREKEGTALGAAMLAAGMAGWKTDQWKTLEMLPPITVQISAQEAQTRYQKWQNFVHWCKQKKV